MSYEKTIRFSGNFDKAIEVAKNTLMPNGFTIANNDEDAIELRGPGSFWTKGQNPLVGVSWIRLEKIEDSVLIKAEFGGVKKTIIYLCCFILAMAVFFLVLFGILFSQKPPTHRFLIPLAPFIPWPFIIPVMAIILKWRASKSLDALSHNIAMEVGISG
jgi:hypothetical protein